MSGYEGGVIVIKTLIVNGKVYDGTGAPWFRADVLLKDGLIEAVGKRRTLGGSMFLLLLTLFHIAVSTYITLYVI